jgi:hypothetical protein
MGVVGGEKAAGRYITKEGEIFRANVEYGVAG